MPYHTLAGIKIKSLSLIRSNKKRKIKPPCLIDFLKNRSEKLMINFLGPKGKTNVLIPEPYFKRAL